MMPMTESRILSTGRAFVSAVAESCATTVSDTDTINALRDTGTVQDEFLIAQVLLVGELIRRGVFTTHGYTRPEYAIADLLGWDRRPARRRVKLAEQLCPRTTLDGQPLPALLPATATVFAEARISVAVAEAIVAVLTGPAAHRLPPEIWAGVEEQVAHYAATHRTTPTDITGWARQLIEAYDQDGPEPDHTPDQINELRLTRKPTGTGGYIRGELDGPTFEAVATAIGAQSGRRPGIERSFEQRQADALGEICGFSLRHDDTTPDTGGERPQIRLTLNLDTLRTAVGGAHLDTGAWYSPSQLRMLACDACIIPAVLNTTGEPLDIGRATRTIPAGIRRAVAIRDNGCAYPGCGQPPARCEVHHCTEWALGGDTALHNCAMVCPAHHRIIHSAGWTVRIHNSQPEFTPPPFLDPHQRIRRKPRLVNS
jgi:5-methylcytosine-specific restriction protein A